MKILETTPKILRPGRGFWVDYAHFAGGNWTKNGNGLSVEWKLRLAAGCGRIGGREGVRKGARSDAGIQGQAAGAGGGADRKSVV